MVQAEHDVIAPLAVGSYLVGRLPDGVLQTLPVKGHFPHIALPQACVDGIGAFVEARVRGSESSPAA